MKSILSTNPTFTPGAANTGTLNFSAVNGFNIAGLLAVLNQTRGVLLYATGEANTGYFSWNNSTKVLTLKVDTSTHSSGDQLQVIYDKPDDASSSSPAQTANFTSLVTNQIITSSPAILVGVIHNTYVGQAGATIKSGSTFITSGVTYGGGWFQIPTNGIDCPSGITLTTAQVGSNAPTNISTTICYIVK